MNEFDLNLIKNLRHTLHSYPELSGEEVFTKSTLISFLKKYTSLEILDYGIWFYAIYKGNNSYNKIGFRADFDAVPVPDELDVDYRSKTPGIGHKCGHDGHAAILVALAMWLEKNGSNNDIYLIFQSAEEIGKGALQCMEIIKEVGLDEIYAYHNMPGYPYGTIVCKDGTLMCASKGLEMFFEGIPTHASTPELGINPAMAISEIVSKIPTFTDNIEYKGLVLCTIIQVNVGDKAFGCSASKGKLLMTIRGQYGEDMNYLEAQLIDYAKEQCSKYGLKYGMEIHDPFPETTNHAMAVEKIKNTCDILGMPFKELKEPIRCSEDFGHFLKYIKGAMFYVGNGENLPPLHDNTFDFPDGHIPIVVKIFSELLK